MNGMKARRIAAVERYIHELAIALAGVSADEREDVIAGVREHIEDSLADIDDPAPDDVERVLASLGDPVEIAADARGRSGSPYGTADASTAATSTVMPPAGAPASAGPPSAPARVTPGAQARPLLTRDWIPVGVMGLFILAAFTTWLTGPGSALGVLFWFGGMVALVASPLWSVAEKIVGALWFGVAPIVTAAAGVVFGWFFAGPRGFVADRPGPFRSVRFSEWEWWMTGVGVGLIGLIVTVVIMAWLVVVGTRRAQHVATRRD